MDIVIQWGVFRDIRHEIKANALILTMVIIFDVIVLAAFLVVKAQTDMLVIYTAVIGMLAIFVGERFFLRANYEG
jgi:hypothetical protein